MNLLLPLKPMHKISQPLAKEIARKPVAFLWAGAILLLCCTGCLRSSLAKVLEQMKNDPAQVDVDIGTIYGTVHVHRKFPEGWTPPSAQPRVVNSKLPVMPPQVFGWEWIAMPKTNAP